MESDVKSTAEEFEDFFNKTIFEFSERKHSSVDIMNALGCSIVLLAMRSEDPKGHIAKGTARMNAYVAYLEGHIETVSKSVTE